MVITPTLRFFEQDSASQNFGVVSFLKDSSVDTSMIWILFTKYVPLAFAEQCIIPQMNFAAKRDDKWTGYR